MKLLLYMNMKNSKLLVLSMFGLASLFCQAEPYNCPQHGLRGEHESDLARCPFCAIEITVGEPCHECHRIRGNGRCLPCIFENSGVRACSYHGVNAVAGCDECDRVHGNNNLNRPLRACSYHGVDAVAGCDECDRVHGNE